MALVLVNHFNKVAICPDGTHECGFSTRTSLIEHRKCQHCMLCERGVRNLTKVHSCIRDKVVNLTKVHSCIRAKVVNLTKVHSCIRAKVVNLTVHSCIRAKVEPNF